ncbi:hypothetical protein GGU10DRAFT_144990 [Lentinula aff. detonsa]|uniref:Uncharacterized protein n=1 Tax=Lentinula aff. detonsa TaxID=2804958 RepID=A0AA38KKN4_9AGAR|nr:hypothetical protein GGU10DRAFT_144990 [Lentinula aff. detonsa]
MRIHFLRLLFVFPNLAVLGSFSAIHAVIAGPLALRTNNQATIEIELIRYPHVGKNPIATQTDQTGHLIPPPGVDEFHKPVAQPIDKHGKEVKPPSVDEDWHLCIGGSCLALIFDVSPQHLKIVTRMLWDDELAEKGYYIGLGKVTFQDVNQMYSVIKWFRKGLVEAKQPRSNLRYLNAIIDWFKSSEATGKGIKDNIQRDVWVAYLKAMNSVGGPA